VTVTLEDVRSVGYCSRGAREFCARHEINWSMFIQQGVAFEDVESITDPMFRKVIDAAREREHGR
jgi:hypothetical protein